MAINKRYQIRKSENEPKSAMIDAIYFYPESEYYRQEEWKEILDWMVPGIRKGAYLISNYGRVSSNIFSTTHPNGAILSQSINSKGYFQINLQSELLNENGKPKRICCKIHRLVMLAFGYIPGCQAMEVDHIDEDNSNNTIWNLQWVTPRQNTQNGIYKGEKSVSFASTGGRFVTDTEAEEMFNKLVYAQDIYDVQDIADKYNVSYNYALGLRNGSIRPYYKKQYIKNGNTLNRLTR